MHTHPFNGPFSGTTQVSRYQKGKTDLDFTEARDSEWQWRQLGHMQVCTLLQTDNHASTPPLCFFTGRMPFLPPNQQRQSTEVNIHSNQHLINTMSNSKDIFRLTNLTTRSRNYCGIGIIHYAKLTKWCFRICCFFTEFWEPYLFDI